MRVQKPFSVIFVSMMIFLIAMNPVVIISSTCISNKVQSGTSIHGMANASTQDNITFTSGKTLNLTSGTTFNFSLGPKMTFSSGVFIQFTDTDPTSHLIQPCSFLRLLANASPLMVCSWWDMLNASVPTGDYAHVDSVFGDTFHIDHMIPHGWYGVDPGEVITAEQRIDNITQQTEFLIRDLRNLTSPANSWWRISSPTEWKNVTFHVDWFEDANDTFHIDQVRGAIPQVSPLCNVTAEQAVTGIDECATFIVEDPALTPEPCSWWEIIDPKPVLGRGFHVDWRDAEGAFHADQVEPNIIFSEAAGKIVAEKRINAIQPGVTFKFVATGGYNPSPYDWWEILYPQEFKGTEFRIGFNTTGGYIHVDQVYPSNKTLSTPVYKLIVEKKIHTIAKENSFKVIDPTSWMPEVGSWWNVTLPIEWIGTVFHVGSYDSATNFRVDYVNKTPMQLPVPPWNVTAQRVLVHDIAVRSVSPNMASILQGWLCLIFVTVENRGSFQETFDVDVRYIKQYSEEGPPVTTSPMKVQNLQKGENKTLCFYWITKGVSIDAYRIRAYAHEVECEITAENNNKESSFNVNVNPPPNLCFNEGFGDYAPVGMPDFDQRQDDWKNPISGNWSHCSPTAIANALWWYDSRFEPRQPPLPQPELSDEFPLVSSYLQPLDDHDPANAPMLIAHLAELMDTDGQRTQNPATAHNGTRMEDMRIGLAQYLSWCGVNPLGDVNGDGTVNQTDIDIVNSAMNSTPGTPNWNMAADIYPVTQGLHQWLDLSHADNIVNASDLELIIAHLNETGLFSEYSRNKPDRFEIENEVKQGQTVVLSIGYWCWNLTAWVRDSRNHFVTVAGINASQLKICISDPMFDARETGLVIDGYIPIPHTYQHNATVHNNAQFVSYDGYDLQSSIIPTAQPQQCPGGNWTLKSYPGKPGQDWLAVIESAIMTSPLGTHELAIASIKTSKDGCKSIPVVCQNFSMTINITIANRGNFTETFNVTSYVNSSVGISQSMTLESGKTTTITTVWDTTGLDKGNYSISAFVQAVPYEFHISDNNSTWGPVSVTMPGDINGDRIVNIFDIVPIALAFSAMPTDPNWDATANIIDDGVIDIFDLVVVAVHFGEKDP